MARRNKYRNKKIVVDGITFDSIKEGERYQELQLLVRAGEIKDLELQPSFTLQDGFTLNGKRIRPITYRADFAYYDHDRQAWIIEDVKGIETDIFKLKRKMLFSRHLDKFQSGAWVFMIV